MNLETLVGFRPGERVTVPGMGIGRIVRLHPPALVEVETDAGGRTCKPEAP